MPVCSQHGPLLPQVQRSLLWAGQGCPKVHGRRIPDPVLRECVRDNHTLYHFRHRETQLTSARRDSVHGRVLPNEFWIPDSHGCRGGVEMAMMSTTLDRAVERVEVLHERGFLRGLHCVQ